jgi:hypothetical protein
MTAPNRIEAAQQRRDARTKVARSIFGFVLWGAILLVLLVGLVQFGVEVNDMPNGARYCKREVTKAIPAIWDSAVVVQTVWTRTLDRHPVSALLIQWKALKNDGQVTLICHFKSRDYDLDHLEEIAGDKIAALKRITRSPFAFVNDAWEFGLKKDSTARP